MKKILCTLLSLSMVIALAGCGDSSDDKSERKSSESSVSETSAEETEAETTIAETSEEDEISVIEEEVSESSAVDEESSEEEAADPQSGSFEKDDNGSNVYTSDTYKLTYSDDWEIKKEAAVFDCILNYVGGTDREDAATNIGVQIVPGAGVLDMDQMVDSIISTYEGKEGYSVESSNPITFKDYEAYEIVLKIKAGSEALKMRQILFKEGSSFYAFDITVEESRYEKMMPQIEEIINTFEYIG